MSKFITLSAMLIGLFCQNYAFAKEPIPDASYFVGTWKLVTARPKLDMDNSSHDKNLKDTPFAYLAGNSNKQFDETWEFFPDGTFALSAVDHRASGTITTKSIYEVENDTLKIGKVGRPGKFYRYIVYKREGNDLILKGGLEGYYFFTKQ